MRPYLCYRCSGIAPNRGTLYGTIELIRWSYPPNTGDTESVKSIGTAWRTAWLTWWSYSLYYRWHWECKERWDTLEDGQTYTMVIFCATFAVPLLSLAYTYTCVGRRLWLRASPGNADPTRDLAQLRAKRKVTLKTEISFCLV